MNKKPQKAAPESVAQVETSIFDEGIRLRRQARDDAREQKLRQRRALLDNYTSGASK